MLCSSYLDKKGRALAKIEVAVTHYKNLLDCYYNCFCCVMFLGCPPMADIRSLTQKCFSSCCDGLVNCKFLDCLLLVSDNKYTNLTQSAVSSNFQTTYSPPPLFFQNESWCFFFRTKISCHSNHMQK